MSGSKVLYSQVWAPQKRRLPVLFAAVSVRELSLSTLSIPQMIGTMTAPCLLAYLSALIAGKPLLWCCLSAQKLSG